ncbi:MAG TPA: type II toxin-antitoxin system prevent-host-death family antitoxin [Acidobacteriaceae bacterium]|nr:type II toxin-antitoxin system prevent-host-death family antitoxin [Acidobacteriaceae bacterium]
MKTVNIGELKNRLSAYLQYVRNGEEVVVRDRSVPVARILPFHGTSASDEEAQLVASGAMKLPEQKMNWNSFFSRPKGNVSRKVAVAAAVESRGDR